MALQKCILARLTRIAATWSALLALSPSAHATDPVQTRSTCERILVTADPAYAPLHWYDGHEMRGASIELAVAVLRKLGLPYEVRYVGPWKRVLALAQAGAVDMVVTLKDTAERREYLRYVPTPAFSNPIAAFVLKSRGFPFKGIEDLVGRRGGVSAGNELGGEQGQAIARRLHLEPGTDAEHNFAKLKVGHLDYFVTGYYTGQAVLAHRADGADFQALQPFLLTSSNYMAFVRTSPCAQYLGAFDKVLSGLVSAGAAEQALKHNLEIWRLQGAQQSLPAGP